MSLLAELSNPLFSKPQAKLESRHEEVDNFMLALQSQQVQVQNCIIRQLQLITPTQGLKKQLKNQQNIGKRPNNVLGGQGKKIDQIMFQNELCFQLQAFDYSSYVRLYTYNTSKKHDFNLEYSFVLDTVQKAQTFVSKTESLTFRQKLKCMQYFRTGNRCFLAKNFLSASQSFKNALEVFQGFHCCYNSLANIQYLQNRSQIAVKHLQRALVQNQKNAYLWNNMALQYINSDVNKALQCFNTSIRIEATYTALTNLATLHFQLGDYNKAEAYFNQSMQTQKTERAAVGLAVTYCFQNDQSKSQDYFERAYNNSVQGKMVLLQWGNKYLYRQSQQFALKVFQKGRRQYPDQPDFLNGIGNCYMKGKDYNKSLQKYVEALKIRNQSRYHTNYIISLIHSDKVDQAIQHLLEICKSEHVIGDLNIVEIVNILTDHKRHGEVIGLLDRILARLVKKPKFLYMLLNQKASLHAYKKEYEHSLSCLLQAEKLRGQPKILLNIAIILHKLKKTKQSYQYLQKIQQQQPNFADSYYYLGAFLAYQKKYNEALIYFEKFKQLKQNDPKVLNAIGVVHFQLKNYAKSYNYIMDSLNYNPEYLPALTNLHQIPYAKNRHYRTPNKNFVDLNNKFPLACFNKANELALVKRYERAEQFYLKALHSYHKSCEVHHNLGMSQIMQGKYKQGIKNLKKAITADYQSYKSCIQFTIHAQGRYSERHLVKLTKKMKALKQHNFKTYLNIAIISNLMKDKLQYQMYLQRSFSYFIEDGQLIRSKPQALDGIRFYQQVSDHIDNTCKQVMFQDLRLMLGLLYRRISFHIYASENAIAYLKYFKLKRQMLVQTFVRIIKINLVQYSQINQNCLINLLVESILKQNQEQGTLCYFKIKSMFPLFSFQEHIKQRIEQRKLKIIRQITYLSTFLDQDIDRRIEIQKDNQTLIQIQKINQLLQNYTIKQLQSEKGHSLQPPLKQAYKCVLIRNKLLKFESKCKFKRFYKKHRRQATKLKQAFNELLSGSLKQNQQAEQQKTFIRTKLLQIQLSKFIHNKWLIYQLDSCDMNRANIILIKIMQGYYNNNFQNALKEIFQQRLQEEDFSMSSIRSFSKGQPQIYKQQPAQSISSSEKNRQFISLPSPKIETLKKVIGQIEVAQKMQPNNKSTQPLKNLRKRSLSKYMLFNFDAKSLSRHLSLPSCLHKKQAQSKKVSYGYQQQFGYKLSKKSLMRKLSCHSEQTKCIQMTSEQSYQLETAELKQTRTTTQKRKLISFQSGKGDKSFKFFKKMLYFSKIALVEELAKLQPSFIAQIMLVPQKNRTGNQFKIKKVKSNFTQFEYLIKFTSQNELQRELNNCSKEKCLKLLKQLARILLSMQEQGIHCTSFKLKNFGFEGKKLFYNQLQPLFRICPKQEQSYKLVKNLACYWLSMESSTFADQLMRNFLLKGLSKQRIDQLFTWKLKIQKSFDKRKRVEQNMAFLMSQIQTAMKQDHINQFKELLQNIFRLQPSDSEAIEMEEQQQILQILQNCDVDDDPLRLMIGRLSIIGHQRYKELKEIMYYVGSQMCMDEYLQKQRFDI